tara:strand:+ start:448 stop:753 length:306 start_codon:yes stop_codon:yes gene_type:complete
MIIYVDIDETICFYEDERHYPDAIPDLHRVSRVNELYDEGNIIVYYTARGTKSGIDWTSVTKGQLKLWGCKYHELSVGQKPVYDLIICDKAINSEDFFNNE